MSDLKKQFHEKGFVQLYEPQGIDLIGIDNYDLLNKEDRLRDNGRLDLDKNLVSKLDLFSLHLHQKYILPQWEKSSFSYWIIWDGVDNDNTGWHTDFMEKYDLFFLYYFDLATPDVGGSISFRWDKNETYTHYPKPGDLFLVNNSKGFWHKAEHTKVKRRVASFNFLINE